MDDIPVEQGSGDIFAGLGFSAAEARELNVKSLLISSIGETIKKTRTDATNGRRAVRDRSADPFESAARPHGKRDDRSARGVVDRAWPDR